MRWMFRSNGASIVARSTSATVGLSGVDFHEPSQTFVISTADQVYEEPESDFLAIGRSGGDGIDFGYRKGIDGLWAFYPIERDFKLMAKSVAELAEAWCAGKLCV